MIPDKKYIEELFRGWASQDDLTVLYIDVDLDGTGEPFRIWWLYCNGSRAPIAGELSNREMIDFFSARHGPTFVDRMLLNNQS